MDRVIIQIAVVLQALLSTIIYCLSVEDHDNGVINPALT